MNQPRNRPTLVPDGWHTVTPRGARSLEEPSDLPYGDRRGMVADRWGNVWQIATHHSALKVTE
jgi:uncharacterized glyoxalase superfamily protein PhnB